MHDDFPEMRIYVHSVSPIFSNGRPGRKESKMEAEKIKSHMNKRSFFGKISIF